MGSIAPALVPRARRRGRSVIVSKVAAATSDLGAFFILVSKILRCSVERSRRRCAAVRFERTRVRRLTPYPECARFPWWCNSPSPLLPLHAMDR